MRGGIPALASTYRHSIPVSGDEDISENQQRLARHVARDAVARELLARRLTVCEAAAVLDWLDRQPPEINGELPHANRFDSLRKHGVGSDLMDTAEAREQWLCLRAVEYAIDLASFEYPEHAGLFCRQLDTDVRRAWAGGQPPVLPMVDEISCQSLVERSMAVVKTFSALGPYPPVPAWDLRLVVRR